MDPLRRFDRRFPVPHGPREVRAPRRGSFTQCVCVLLERAIPVTALVPLLEQFDVRKEVPATEGPYGWALGGPSLILSYRPDVNGFVQVDVVDHDWPDAMGKPNDTAPLFAAWAMGAFGPSPTTRPRCRRITIRRITFQVCSTQWRRTTLREAACSACPTQRPTLAAAIGRHAKRATRLWGSPERFSAGHQSAWTSRRCSARPAAMMASILAREQVTHEPSRASHGALGDHRPSRQGD